MRWNDVVATALGRDARCVEDDAWTAEHQDLIPMIEQLDPGDRNELLAYILLELKRLRARIGVD